MIVRNREARRGISLIELLVIMTGVAVILGLCAVTIQVLFRVSSDTQARRSASAALGRLAEQFREDVHACDGAELQPAAGLRLSRDRARGDRLPGARRTRRPRRVDRRPGEPA